MRKQSSSCWAPHIPLAPWICVLVAIGWDDLSHIQAQTMAHGYTCASDLSETPWHNLHLETIQLVFQSDLGGLASSTDFNKVAVLFLLWLFQYSAASIMPLQPFIVTQNLWKEVKFPTARGIPCIGRRSGSLFHVSFTVTFLFFSSSIDSVYAGYWKDELSHPVPHTKNPCSMARSTGYDINLVCAAASWVNNLDIHNHKNSICHLYIHWLWVSFSLPYSTQISSTDHK